jgi:cysteine desulfurase/selenocysteine lyase
MDRPGNIGNYENKEGFIDLLKMKEDGKLSEFYPQLLGDLDDLRVKDFPLFEKQDRVYLDNAATTQEPQSVKDRMYEYRSAHIRGSSHSKNSAEAREVQRMFDEARRKVQDFFHADNYVVAFTSGTTGSSNFIATRFPFRRGDSLILTDMEHNSQILSARNFAKKADANIYYVPIASKEGRLDLDNLRRTMSKTKRGKVLMNLVHVSNFSGVVNPVEEIRDILGDRGFIYLDMAQSAGRMPIDLDALDVDFAGISAHKMYGPMGMGAVFVNKRSVRSIGDAVSGGSAIDMVSKWFTVPAGYPDKYEPGTQDLEGAIEWGFAIDYLEGIGMDRIEAHEEELGRYFLKELQKIEGVRVYGPLEFKDRIAVVTFNIGSFEKKTYEEVAREMDRRGISVRDGCLCAHIYAAQQIGLPKVLHEARAAFMSVESLKDLITTIGAVRVSFGFYNSMEDAFKALRAIKEIAGSYDS